MNPSGIQSLIVFTDPACLFTMDLVHEGDTSAPSIASRVSERLGIPVSQAAEVLDGLVGIGFVARTSLDEVESLGLAHFASRLDEATGHLAWLRSVGDEEHASDTVAAIYAAWDLRSDNPLRTRRGEAFRTSPAGIRHSRRLEGRCLGRAYSSVDLPADVPAESIVDSTVDANLASASGVSA